MPLWSVTPSAVAACDPNMHVVTWQGRTAIRRIIPQGVLIAYPTYPSTWHVDGWFVPAGEDPDLLMLAVEVLLAEERPPHASMTVAPSDRLVRYAVEQSRSRAVHPVTTSSGPSTVCAVILHAGEALWVSHVTEPLTVRAPGLRIERLSAGILPVGETIDSYGSWHGWPWKFRLRHGTATLDVGQNPAEPLWTADVHNPRPLGEVPIPQLFMLLFEHAARNLDRATFLFHFADKNLSPPTPNKAVEYPYARAVWAHDARSAFTTLNQTILTSYSGRPVELHPEPLVPDTRSYPVTAPEFTVYPADADPDTCIDSDE